MNRLEISVCVIIFVIIAAMFLPNVRDASGTARRVQCLNNMRNVGMAVQTYAVDHNGAIPATAAGDPPQSWRLHLMPYLEGSSLYDEYQFDIPWNEGMNQEPAKRGIEVYTCPDNPDETTEEGFSITSYVAITGTNAMWGKEKSLSLDEVAEADGLSQTFLIVENAAQQIVWTEPRDVDMDTMKIKIESLGKWSDSSNSSDSLITTYHRGLANVLFVDGSGRSISEDIDPEILKRLCTATGGDILTSADY